MAQRLKRLPAMQETWVRSLGREDPLEKEMETHSSILAWRISREEELHGLQSTSHKELDTTERLHTNKHYGEIGFHSTIYEAVQANSRSVQFSKTSNIQTEVSAVTRWDYFGEDRNTKSVVRRKEVLTERFDFNDCDFHNHGLYLSSVKEIKYYLLSLYN